MMNNFQHVISELKNTKLVAVSKTQTIEKILGLYQEGQRVFGENKVQELVDKEQALPKDIEWHLIGHLQTNKVKAIAPFVYMIHGVDSLKLLFEIEKQASKCNRMIKVLLQIHIAQEETKFGLNKTELVELLDYYTSHAELFPFTQVVGLMGMATNTDDKDLIRSEFKNLFDLFTFVKETYLLNKPEFTERSMGMSHDYKIAIEEGSTMARIGSLLFSDR